MNKLSTWEAHRQVGLVNMFLAWLCTFVYTVLTNRFWCV